METPRMLLEAVTYFADPDRAHEFATRIRWAARRCMPAYELRRGESSVYRNAQALALQGMQAAVYRGNVHTNSIENFWSVLKRTLAGTYICARSEHLDAYLDEQIFRFNSREDGDGPRFAKTAKGTDGKRLTYKALTGKEY